MIGSQVGPYTITAELGSGGMGTVYLGEGDGKKVALKVVHPHLIATPGFFKRFLREAEVGKQVNHENVVRTLDVDATMVDDKQINYMVMEYVEGKNLRELLADLDTVPETLLREIALQIAEGVSAIHAEGIVHRDLKPENVLITDDHRIRIMDLGVAKLQEASVALTQEGQFAGSFLYAAPEQFSGGAVGLQADLYSIGVMLIEMATGRNPFQHEDAGAVINAHLRNDPPRTADLNADYSLFFSEIIATLLAKEPSERIESSTALRSLLEQGEKSDWWAAQEKELRTRRATLPKVTVRRDTDLHGRESEIELLRSAWEQAKQGHGNTVLIEGEAGIGKTRLVDMLLRSLETEDAHFLYGSYPPTGGLGGLSESILGKFGEAGLEESLAPYLTVTPSLIPAFAALVKHEAPPTGSEPLGGDALHAIGCHLVRALAAEKPTIWIIEDLHSGPEDARGFLLALARAVGSHRVLLIATSRAELPEETMVNFQRLENFQRLTLSRLGARDVIGLVQDALKSRNLADKLGAQIAYKSDGVPFFVFELIRALKEGRLIKEMPDGSHVQTEVISDLEVPSAVKDLVESRLKNLTKEERALLDVGAVQGYEFEPDLVARVLELKKISVLQDLAEIERRTGLIHGEAGKCRFDQYQIQEVLYRALMPDLRTEYHAMLADAYAQREEIEDDAEGDEAYFLADHHLRGSRPKAARPHLDAALDWLEKTHRNDSAIELADRALATKRLLKGTDRAEVLLRKSARLRVIGRSIESREALDEALGSAEELGDPLLRARVHLECGMLERGLGNYAIGATECGRARALAREAGDVSLEVRAASELATILHFHGKLDEAHETIQDALETARSASDREGERSATTTLAILLRTMGRYTEAQEQHEKLLQQGES
ncbi:MAG: protein kinase domain-containing protein, partial [Planctomycetota bacterium]